MKKLNRWIALLLCFLMVIPSGVWATEDSTDGFLFRSLDIEDGFGILSGTYKDLAGIELEATFEMADATSTYQTKTGANGEFVFLFLAEGESFALSLRAESGDETQMTFDLSGVAELFRVDASTGYSFSGVTYCNEYLSLRGSHQGQHGDLVNVRIDHANGKTALVTHDFSDEDEFDIKFKLAPGSYKLNLRAGELEMLEKEFAVPAFQDNLIASGDTSTEGNTAVEEAARQFEKYAIVLDGLISMCAAKGLEPAYEKAQVAIIRKFTEYLVGYEQLHSYLEQFKNSLAEIYQETQKSLYQYLNGEKVPMTVPKYQTGDLRIDGNSLYGSVLADGKTEEKPVFFVGYGPWETTAEEVPFFSQIGMNIIQAEIEMNSVIVPGVFQDWIDTSYVTNAVFSLDPIFKANGKYSFKLVNNNLIEGRNNIRTLSQTIPVKPNTTYTFGLKAMGSGIAQGTPSAVWFSVRGWNVNGRVPIYDTPVFVDYGGSYTTGSAETELTLILFTEGYVDEVYFDDVYVKEQGSSINLVKNPGFDEIPAARSPQEQAFLDEGYFIDHTKIDWLKGVLKNAEEHNVLVDLALGINYISPFILAEDPNMTAHTEYFLPFNMDHEKLRRITLMWGDLMGSIASEYDSVHTMCILNEPEVHCYTSDYYKPRWYQYLEEKYGTITKLNDAYGGTSYTDFTQVIMPSEIEKTPRFYDFRVFNDGILDEYIAWFAGEMKKMYPDIKMHTKMMDYVNYSWPRFIRGGTDWNRQKDYTDLNGCDSFGYYDYENVPMHLRMAWYDYMSSLKDAPVWDTESHLLNDYNIPKMDEIIPYHYSADVWNGAIHGRGGQVIWLWDLRSGSLPGGWSNYPNANAVLRPDAVAKAAKAAMDLNRLAEEVSALQDVVPEVGLFFSRTTLGYDDYSQQRFSDFDQAYQEIIGSGQKAGFVVDAAPEEISKYKLLIVPETTHVLKEMVDGIYQYLKDGGEVLLLGENCLRYDEHGKAHDAAMLQEIYAMADTESTVTEKIKEMELSDVVLVDAETNAQVEGIEWSYTDLNGNYIVNIINYEYDLNDVKRVKVLYRGQEIQTLHELRNGTTTTSGILELKPYEPILVSFEHKDITLDLVDAAGNVLADDIDRLQSGIIQINTEIDGMVIGALYEGDTLVKAYLDKDSMTVSLEDGKEYRLMATVWDRETLAPKTKSVTINNKTEVMR